MAQFIRPGLKLPHPDLLSAGRLMQFGIFALLILIILLVVAVG